MGVAFISINGTLCQHFEPMKLAQNRISPSSLSASDRLEVQRLLAEVFSQPSAKLVAANGEQLPLPEPVFQMLVRVLSGLRDKKAMVLMPEDEAFTTQAGADYLGMSRPYFVTLLESGKIPFHRVGTHRRVYLKDLLAFQSKRDKERRAAMDELRRAVYAEGLEDD